MKETETIVEHMKRALEGEAWHGPALREILADVSADMAAAKPVAGAHSIWELVLHIAAWEDVFCRRLEGHPVDTPVEGDFPPVDGTNPEEWARARARLDGVHARLLASISGLSGAALGETVPGKDYTIGYMLHGILQHNVYHAGQIALLRKALLPG